MRIQLWLPLFSLVFFSAFGRAQTAPTKQERPLTASGQLSAFEIQGEQIVELKVDLSLPSAYRAYSDQFKLRVIEPYGFKIKGYSIDPLQSFYDPNTKKTKKGVIGTATLTAPVEAPASLPSQNVLKIGLTYQACTKTYCLLPIEQVIDIPFKFVVAKPSMESVGLFQQKFQDIVAKSLLLSFLFVFVAGILTSFTPCIFPMIPITIAVLGRNAHQRSRRQHLLVTVMYILGIALTYATLGLIAAYTGAIFGSVMSHPVTLSIMCLLFLALALSMFGLYELQAPAFVRDRLGRDHKLGGYVGALVQGVIAGVVASPCVGPVLVGILTYVAQTQNLWLGFWLLFVFALGMGLLFLVFGMSSQLTKLLPRSGAWMEGVKTFFGLVMLIPFYYYLDLLLPERWFHGALGLGLVILGSFLGAFDKSATTTRLAKLKKGMCFAAILIGALFLAQAVLNLRSSQKDIAEFEKMQSGPRFQIYSEAAVAAASKAGRPVIVDFWAEWCAACIQLEKRTFSQPSFQELAKDFVLLKFDATNDSPEFEKHKAKYGIVGLPTVIFLDRKGKWLKDLTVNEFIEAPEFTERMKKVP